MEPRFGFAQGRETRCLKKMNKQYFIYIMSSRSSTLYIGSVHNLLKRVLDHKEKIVDGFTKRYSINRLVFYEACETSDAAINSEKQLKGWTRAKKIALIESVNPEWKDLSLELMYQEDEKQISEKPVIKRGTLNLYRKRGDSAH
jgi:putative endonuclease